MLRRSKPAYDFRGDGSADAKLRELEGHVQALRDRCRDTVERTWLDRLLFAVRTKTVRTVYLDREGNVTRWATDLATWRRPSVGSDTRPEAAR